MLRITQVSDESSGVRLKLEGRIMAEWVPLLTEECLRILKEKKSLCLDFSDVTFVDDRGVEMLKAMTSQGIELMNCSPLVASLLQDEEGGSS